MLIPTIYNMPTKQDICIGLAFFSPVNYEVPKRNLLIVLDQLTRSNIPFFTIELLYANQSNIVPNPTMTVYGKSIIFSKENLWNILETKIPENYNKIVFIDADIKFSDPEWLDKASIALDTYDVIQPMEYVYKDILPETTVVNMNTGQHHKVIAKSIAENTIGQDNLHGHPGYAIGIRRDFFHKIGGIVDYGIIGYGDAMFWGCFHTLSLIGTNFGAKLVPEYRNLRKQIYNLKTDTTVGYIKDIYSLHLYHGNAKNRRYGNRDTYVPNQLKLYKNEYGVLEILADYDLIQYWKDRKEDD
jgi:hypothetical protein